MTLINLKIIKEYVRYDSIYIKFQRIQIHLSAQPEDMQARWGGMRKMQRALKKCLLVTARVHYLYLWLTVSWLCKHVRLIVEQ